MAAIEQIACMAVSFLSRETKAETEALHLDVSFQQVVHLASAEVDMRIAPTGVIALSAADFIL